MIKKILDEVLDFNNLNIVSMKRNEHVKNQVTLQNPNIKCHKTVELR